MVIGDPFLKLISIAQSLDDLGLCFLQSLHRMSRDLRASSGVTRPPRR